MTTCGCGLPVARRTSWTHDNPGRKFVACQFSNHETGDRGYNSFDWIDEWMTDWQRDVINKLVAEKQRLANENNNLRSRLVCEEYERERLASDVENLKKRQLKKKEATLPRNGLQRNELGGRNVFVSAIVATVLSFIIVKLFG